MAADSDLDEKSTLKKIVEKLYEAIYYKMSESTSVKSVNNSLNEKLETDQKLNETLGKKKSGGARKLSNAPKPAALGRKLSMIVKETPEEKPEAVEVQVEPPKVLHLDTANIFDLEAMRQTPKLLALQPLRPRQSVKESMHSIFDMYDSGMALRQDSFDAKSKRSRSTYLSKEKSTVSQNSARASAKNGSNRVKFNME